LKTLKLKTDVVTRWDSAYAMLSRAIFLRRAIEPFVQDEDDDLDYLALSSDEWDMCELLVTILLPFKKASQSLQATARPGIHNVFWTYENLFNKIDKIKSTFNLPQYRDEDWAHSLHEAVDKMAAKLRKYYDKTAKPYVYPEGVILDPFEKLILFKQETWESHYAEQYRLACRQRYIKEYESTDNPLSKTSNQLPTKKRKYLAPDDDDENNYRTMLHRLTAHQVKQNEFDRFIDSPVEDNDDMDTLDWWKLNYKMFPHLAQMARDVYAVPATGAGVERQFSKSGRVATCSRALLNPDTVCDIMMYKDYLSRTGKPLTPGRHGLEIYADGGDDEEKDEDPEDSAKMIQWEKEWWQKADARLNF
jgi:hypothetical protein